ncbi:MAG: RNA methyltransferase [Treponema sp.]|nr:RNA methyltransferase [Treponema sp.]
MRLSDVIIVLSRPSEAGNVGAVCRAMKNMNLSRLRLCAPEFADEPATLSEAGFSYGSTEAVIRARAVHAAGIWEKAEVFDTLADAVKDCALVIGTTQRRGRLRKQTMTPIETAAFLKEHPGPAALVFGNERTGLDSGEIDLCNFASHIPVGESFPSLNLSHAVMVYTYELFKALAPLENAVKGQWVPLDQETTNCMVRELTDSLKDLGFYKQAGREDQERFFRDVFSRAALTKKEAGYFTGIITKAARLASKTGSPTNDTEGE